MHRLSDQQLIEIINQSEQIPLDEAFKQLLLTELSKRNQAKMVFTEAPFGANETLPAGVR